MSAYRDGVGRPRIVVPGVLVVDRRYGIEPAKLHVGAIFDGFEELTNWKYIATFARPSDMPPLSLGGYPRLAAFVAGAPWIEVLPQVASKVHSLDAFEIQFERRADDFFAIRYGKRSVSGALYELLRNAGVDEEDPDTDLFVERIVRAVTDGAIDGTVIALAVALGQLWKADLSERYDEWERELAELEERANEQREVAVSITHALEEDGSEVDVPVYGRARRVRHRELRLRDEGGDLRTHVSVDGTNELLLPAYDEWLVDDVEDWIPAARKEAAERVGREIRRRLESRNLRAAKGGVAWMAFVLLFVGLVIVAIVTRR